MCLPAFSCCGPLVAVVGGLLRVLSGSLVGGALCHAWSGLVAYCRGVGAILSFLALVPVAATPHFACPGSTIGVGCVALIPCRRPLLCPPPRGWWSATFPAQGRCWPVWAFLLSRLVVAPWPLWSAFAGWGLSPVRAGWSPGYLAVGPVCAVRGLACLRGCSLCWGRCSPLWVCRCCSSWPLPPLVSRFVLVGWEGLPLGRVPAVF